MATTAWRIFAAWLVVLAGSAGAIAAPPDALSRKVATLLDAQVSPRQPGRFAPRDECAALPGARAFREALARAVLRRDASAVAALAAPGIQLGFGGDDGRERFLAGLRQPDGALFVELERVLRLGCAVNGEGGMAMPWSFDQDLGDADVFEVMLVTGEAVALHRSADPASPVLARLSWDYVTPLSDADESSRQAEVTTRDGVRGFVPRERLRSPIDYRLVAERSGGKWRVAAFVAGD
ncbi:hypothetical protein [Novosphingobium album (ex Liu et al. 2023)]|uniref:SH3 domain-containing protein n=1 Tax=Novosphingobium album (ex Liu et al. 2023) TaxID=3031130 RepID=A0ABT5WRS1_9SPHN|nr:hypothetical protein [Novosphingobium album (ex Liu et al. 2023)]MDE8651957.1 hypothetical protein [Novosphingobium album (ex Liu et al. 2023)]